MGALFAALGVGIVSYIAVMLLFPKAVPEDTGDLTRQALDRIYDENRANESPHANILREGLLDEPPLVRMIFGSALMQPIYEAAVEAGYQRSLKGVLLAIIAVGLVSLVALLAAGLGVQTPLMAVILAYYLPYKHCLRRVHKRNHAFINQFPDALDMIVRSVRSGFPLSVALQMLAENAEQPVRAEFRQVVDEMALGRSLQQALGRLAVRINEPDIRFFVVVLSVQQETGGNLAEIINNLSTVIRKRKQLRHKIKAMTSEGRATGWVLGLLPVVVFIALFFIQRPYISVLWTDPLGQMILGGVVAMILSCGFIIKQMVNVEM